MQKQANQISHLHFYSVVVVWSYILLTWGVGETSPRSLPEPRSREKKRIFPVY